MSAVINYIASVDTLISASTCVSSDSQISPFKPNGISHSYEFDKSIFHFKGCWVVFLFLFKF